MGVDLKLLPLIEKDYWAAHDILRLMRRHKLWTKIEALPQQAISGILACHEATTPDGERGYGDIAEDAYGTQLKWTTAADLLTLRDDEAVQDNWQNRAVWAYLAAMPATWKIVLYWS